MAKPVTRKIETKIREGARSVADSIQDLTPGRSRGPSTAAKVATAAGVAVAGAAGIAAAVRYLRRNSSDPVTLHVRANDEGWVIEADGAEEPIASFETKREAVRAAREQAANAAPSDLLIHKSDGSLARSHSYKA